MGYFDALKTERPPAPPIQPAVALVSVPPGTREESYAAAALAAEVANVDQAVLGVRNDTLNSAAFAVGQVAGAGWLERATAEEHLAAAARRVGLPEHEIQATLRSGLDAGEAQPREPLPDQPVPDVIILDEDAEPEAPMPWEFTGGGSFILDTPPDPEPLWGRGGDVLLADGEALLIAGGQGAGKTTLAQQLALGRCGFEDYQELLSYPIVAGDRRLLYLAMDRPRQAARSFRRMVGEAWREELDDRLVVWQGPPPSDLAKTPSLLTALCRKAGADTVVVDSLKDAALKLSEDEVGAGWNRARQTAIAADVQVVELHHNRKAMSGAKAERVTLDDLYGSTWITSGAGSVILLAGQPGDPIVRLQHLKQPANEVGPLQIVHDQVAGRSTIWHAADVVAAACAAPDGLSAVEVARLLFETEKPTAAEKEKARRKLEACQRSGSLRLITEGDQRSSQAARWGAPGVLL